MENMNSIELENFKLTIMRSYGDHALIWSSKYGHLYLVKQLIKYGEDINMTDETGNTPLMYATLKHFGIFNINNNTLVVKYLLENRAYTNIQNKKGRTALMYAWNKLEIAKLLLKYGAGIHIKDYRGNTCLNPDEYYYNLEVVNYIKSEDRYRKGVILNIEDSLMDSGISGASSIFSISSIITDYIFVTENMNVYNLTHSTITNNK